VKISKVDFLSLSLIAVVLVLLMGRSELFSVRVDNIGKVLILRREGSKLPEF